MTTTGETMARAIRRSISDHPDHVGVSSAPRDTRVVGVFAAAVGAGALSVWFVWRVGHLSWHPVPLVFLVAEALGFVMVAVVACGLAQAGARRHVYEREPTDSHWYAVAIADIVGRTRLDDLCYGRRSLRSAPLWRPHDLADATMTAVLLEGPRRLVLVVSLAIGLLLGVGPMSAPPAWATAAALVGYGCLAFSLVWFGRGRLRLGDRMRWSYGAIGEFVGRVDMAGHAPRRWIGSMAVAVGLSLSAALRGFSDRWTHGLAAMDSDDRVTALVLAFALVLGALFTIQTTPRPDPADPAVVVRRLDESSVRQTLLAGAVLLGIIGLLAGVLPGSTADPAEIEPVGVLGEVTRV